MIGYFNRVILWNGFCGPTKPVGDFFPTKNMHINIHVCGQHTSKYTSNHKAYTRTRQKTQKKTTGAVRFNNTDHTADLFCVQMEVWLMFGWADEQCSGLASKWWAGCCAVHTAKTRGTFLRCGAWLTEPWGRNVTAMYCKGTKTGTGDRFYSGE